MPCGDLQCLRSETTINMEGLEQADQNFLSTRQDKRSTLFSTLIENFIAQPSVGAFEMVFLSMSTLESSQDQRGHTHRVDLDLTGKQHNHITVYKGRCFSYQPKSDRRHQNSVICKFHNDDCVDDCVKNSKEWAHVQIEVAQEVYNYGLIFKNIVAYLSSETSIKFVVPQSVNLDHVSMMTKRRNKGEYMLFEDKLENFDCYVDIKGRALCCSRGRRGSRSNSRRPSEDEGQPAEQLNTQLEVPSLPSHNFPEPSCPDMSMPPTYEQSQYEYGLGPPPSTQLPRPSCPADVTNTNVPEPSFYCHHHRNNTSSNNNNSEDEDVPHAVLQAFIHYFFCHKQGTSIVANLKGEYEKDTQTYTLTMPVIHSIDRSHGDRDEGTDGIQSVISNHTCSRLCRNLPSMRSVFRDALCHYGR